MEAVNGIQKAAIELDVFTRLGEGLSTAEEVAAAFLHFTDAVRHGGAVAEPEGTMAPGHPAWVRYARGMMPMALPQARKAAEIAGKVSSVVDIAAGHGMFGILILQNSPRARCLAVDWPNVLELARENADQAGVSDRLETRPGNAFEVDLGSGHDLVLLPNILHHFDREACETLLRRAHGALLPAGRVFVISMIPHEDRVTPSAPAWFATMMLATTPIGDAYTLNEYAEMLLAAGFSKPEAHPIPGSARTILVSSR